MKQSKKENGQSITGGRKHQITVTDNQLKILRLATKTLAHIAKGRSMAMINSMPFMQDADKLAIHDAIQKIVDPQLLPISDRGYYSRLGEDSMAISRVITHALTINNGRLADAKPTDPRLREPDTFGDEPLATIEWDISNR